jgi:hypothetical protein
VNTERLKASLAREHSSDLFLRVDALDETNLATLSKEALRYYKDKGLSVRPAPTEVSDLTTGLGMFGRADK